jgi:hypothetical protein
MHLLDECFLCLPWKTRSVPLSMSELLPYISAVCKETRKESGARVTGVADAAGYDSATTINRFERSVAWPRDPDAVVGAYAKGAKVSPFDLWDEAIRRARKTPAAATPTEAELTAAQLASEHHKAELRKALSSQPQPSRTSGSRTAKSRRGSQKK